MKRLWRRAACAALLCALALAVGAVAACNNRPTEPDGVTKVTICYLGNPVGADGLTVNLVRETVAFSVSVETTGNASDEATLSSSDETVATVSGTNVLLHAAGATTLTATAVADETKTDSIQLTIEPIAPEVVSVTITDENGAAFPDNAVAIAVDSSLTVTVDVAVRGDMTAAYTLTSTDTQIVTVEGDVLSAVGVGSTTVTATAAGDATKTAALTVVAYDSAPQPIAVTGGVAKNAEGQTVTEARWGDKITLVPDEADDGMEFVAWNISGAPVKLVGNTFTFLGVAMSFEAVYGYTAADFDMDFATGGYTCDVDNEAHSVHITYTGVGSHSWNNTHTAVDYPAAETANRFAFTVTNHGKETVKGTAALSSTTTPSNESGRFGKIDFSIEAGETETFVASYAPTAVRNIMIFIDSTEWDPAVPQTNRSGDITISNIAFFAQPEVISIAIADSNGDPFEDDRVRVDLDDGEFIVTVAVTTAGGASNAYTLTSGNESILTVNDNGAITPIAAGSTTITATATADTTKRATLTVIVTTSDSYGVTVTGGKAQINGEDATEAHAGDVLTLISYAAEEGMQFAAWNISTASGKSTIRTNTYTMTSEETTIGAVYGYKPNVAPSFTSDWAYTATVEGSTATIEWNGSFSSSWFQKIDTVVDYPQSANGSKLSITVSNPLDRDIPFMVGVSRTTGTDAADRLNGDGSHFTVHANSTETFTVNYTKAEVKNLSFFFDCGGAEDYYPVGKAVLSHIGFIPDVSVPSQGCSVTVTGGKAQINGEDVTETQAGDVLTLIPNAAEAGMEFVAWNITTVSVRTSVRTNTYTMTDEDTNIEAVYGRVAQVTPTFASDGWAYEANVTGTTASISWNGGFQCDWWTGILTTVDYPQSAQCNTLSFTVTNLGNRDIPFTVGVSCVADDSDRETNRLNGDGSHFTIAAGKTMTFTLTYTAEEVKSIQFFFDAGDSSDKPSGAVVIGNMAFYEQ